MGNERSKECIGMPRRWKGKVGTAVGVRERVSQVRSSSRKGIPSRGNSVGKSTELERTLPSGNCSCLSWQVHGYVGGIMTEPPKWAEGQESQEASTPEWNCAGSWAPDQRTLDCQYWTEALETIQSSPAISHTGKLRPIES